MIPQHLRSYRVGVLKKLDFHLSNIVQHKEMFNLKILEYM